MAEKRIKAKAVWANKDVEGNDLQIFSSSKTCSLADVGQTNKEVKEAILDLVQYLGGTDSVTAVTSIIRY